MRPDLLNNFFYLNFNDTLYQQHQEKKEAKITDFFHTNSESKTDLLTKLIIMENLPFKLVESQYFRKFAQALDPTVQIPCYKTLKQTIRKTFLKEREKIKLTLQKNNSEISVTVDGWTSTNNEPFYGITGY